MGVVAPHIALIALGFTPTGVAIGSIGAATQSMIGSVAVGSWFAAAQSAGAAGLGLTGVTGAVGAGIGYSITGSVMGKAKKEQESDHDETEKPKSKL
eukprot:46139_1